MDDRPNQTPLVELLTSVPKTLRAEWPIQWDEDGRETGHSISPIGKHCHDAADKIFELESLVNILQKELRDYKLLVAFLEETIALDNNKETQNDR